jgi:uncharacterized membrane protein YdbT with pleckstrin-like domain
MSYVEKHLMEGEKIVYGTRLHWIVLVPALLLGALFCASGVALLIASANRTGDPRVSGYSLTVGGAALLAIAVVILVRGILTRNAVQMAVTNKRVIAKVGVVTRRTVDLLLSRVESVGVEESVMGRMLGYGTVVIRGTGGTPESFSKIAHPLEFRTRVQEQIDAMQMKA